MKRSALSVLLLLALMAGTALAQSPVTTYQTPPKAIKDLIDAPSPPAVSVGPMNKNLLLRARAEMPAIDELAQPELRIAGIRINPRLNASMRSSYYVGLTLKALDGGKETPVTGLPDPVRIRYTSWSADGKKVAFAVQSGDGLRLWMLDVATGRASQVLEQRLNAAYGGPFEWVGATHSLLCRLIPAERGDEPRAPEIPAAPVIQETTGKKAPARTYQDLLKNAHDEDLFDYYATSQLALIDESGQARPLGTPAIFSEASVSPDGKYVLVDVINKPYSYLVPASRFPHKVSVWDMAGTVVSELADLPLAENIPIGFGAVATGPRSFSWRADKGAVLTWVEAQDGGDPRKECEVRDRVFMLVSPFQGDAEKLIDTDLRFAGIQWCNDKLALATAWWWTTRSMKTWRFEPGKAAIAPVLVEERSFEDRYNDPGSPVMMQSRYGTYVIHSPDGGKTIFRSGRGASPEGDRPFLDEFNLNTGKTRRLWRSEAPYFESFYRLLDKKGQRFLMSRESQTEPTNLYIKDLKQNALTQVTDFPHPTPQFKDVKKEIIKYTRDDGVQLTATLYLPPGYKQEDGPLPMLMWAYPQEYKSAAAAGQMSGSPYRFTRVYWGGALPWLLHGYAVLDDPAMPIIGEGEEEPNDTFRKQLVASAKAAVDEVVRRGVADRDRIAIGGHSYGAFMTANLLAHSDLFAAGIARSGAYNRTLTPFGFQSEERTYWEAPEIYYSMSPFMHAPKVNEPLLLIHGAADNNPGTFPLQSERYYNALKGHGAKARLVMLPHESHGYRARESVMHCLWEMTEWLDKYVKNKK